MTNSNAGDEPRLNVDFLCLIIYFLSIFVLCLLFVASSHLAYHCRHYLLGSANSGVMIPNCHIIFHSIPFDLSMQRSRTRLTIPLGPKKEEAYLKLPCSKVGRLTRCVTIIHFALFVSTWEHTGSLDCFLFALCYVCLSASLLFAFTFTDRYLLSPVLGGSLLIACHIFTKLRVRREGFTYWYIQTHIENDLL